jgi:bifunctional DNA-binding transcriptional regulator/antitoxin component of YhaV-PrlF toxin-antitoxin module
MLDRRMRAWLGDASSLFGVQGDRSVYLVDFDIVSESGDLRVSARGQMSLPAAARRRWRLRDGGRVGYLDLGDAVVLVPGGVERFRRQILDAVSPDDWAQAAEGFGDPDLASE